jgi:hypothetical protein
MYIVWGVYAKNRVKIRLLDGCSLPIRLFMALSRKNQNKSKLHRIALGLSSPSMYIVWDMCEKNEVKIRLIGCILRCIRYLQLWDKKIVINSSFIEKLRFFRRISYFYVPNIPTKFD